MLLKRYESTEVDRRTGLHVPSDPPNYRIINAKKIKLKARLNDTLAKAKYWLRMKCMYVIVDSTCMNLL